MTLLLDTSALVKLVVAEAESSALRAYLADSALALVRLDDDLLDTAGTLGPHVLRSLDAVHLACALRVAPLDAVITYDARMVGAAASLGVPVVAPGSAAA